MIYNFYEYQFQFAINYSGNISGNRKYKDARESYIAWILAKRRNLSTATHNRIIYFRYCEISRFPRVIYVCERQKFLVQNRTRPNATLSPILARNRKCERFKQYA